MKLNLQTLLSLHIGTIIMTFKHIITALDELDELQTSTQEESNKKEPKKKWKGISRRKKK